MKWKKGYKYKLTQWLHQPQLNLAGSVLLLLLLMVAASAAAAPAATTATLLVVPQFDIALLNFKHYQMID